jgi:hypothetical protein
LKIDEVTASSFALFTVSEAPAIVRTSKLPKGPIDREKTDKEREEEMLTSVRCKVEIW